MPRFFGVGMGVVALLLIFFVLYALWGMELAPLAPNMVFGYINMVLTLAGFVLVFAGHLLGGMRLFLGGMMVCVSLQPFFTLPETLQFSFIINPLIAVSLLVVAGLFFQRTALLFMTAGIFLALAIAFRVRGDSAMQVYTPIVMAAAIGVAVALYFWSKIVDQALCTAREAAQRAEEQARERDLMLRETNHRIKNNLGIVNALIHLKMQRMPPEHSIADLSHQIRTIMLLHEKLHSLDRHGENRVELQRHLRDVVQIVSTSSRGTPFRVEAEEDAPAMVKPEQAVPLGLIVHEVTMNAVKYSFPLVEDPCINLSCKNVDDGHLLLRIDHCGPPLPDDFSVEGEHSFGLQLIDALVRQLQGSIEISRAPTPAFSIRFPL
jgi:two-component sensor histidine kinase